MSTYEPGDHVKVEFTDKTGEIEWMWVEVDSADDERKMLFGRLDSQPIVNVDLRLGQELAVSYSQIRERRAMTR